MPITPEDSPFRVRRSVFVPAPPREVWHAFESKQSMDRWWGLVRTRRSTGMPVGNWLNRYEPGVGGHIEMAVLIDGERTRFGGMIDVFDAGRELSFENDWIPNIGWLKPTRITIRLSPALNGTLVEFFHYGFEAASDHPAEEHAGYEAGWSMAQLRALKAMFD